MTETQSSGLKFNNSLLYYVKRSDKIILIDNNQIILSSIFTAAKSAETEEDYGFIENIFQSFGLIMVN